MEVEQMFQFPETAEQRKAGMAARGFGKNCRPSSAVIAAAQAA